MGAVILIPIGLAAGAAWWLTRDKPPAKKAEPAKPATPATPAAQAGKAQVPAVVPIPVPVAPPPAPIPIPAVPGFPKAGEISLARVTTNDPAPSGDLYIVPSPGAPGIPGVGAEKNGIVQVLDWNAAPDWAKIAWGGGPRLRAVTGYAKRKYLQALPKGGDIVK